MERIKVIDKLKKYIKSSKRTEIKCRNLIASHIELVIDKLTKYTVNDSEVVDIEKEHISSVGKSDLIIKIEYFENKNKKVKVILWECKAPQCFLFDKKNENMLMPTSHLFEAEHQLFHYYENLKGDKSYLNKENIRDIDIEMGGVIIGSQETLVTKKGDYKLYDTARYIRDEYIWRRNRIDILTWSQILEFLDGDTKEYLPVKQSITAKASIVLSNSQISLLHS